MTFAHAITHQKHLVQSGRSLGTVCGVQWTFSIHSVYLLKSQSETRNLVGVYECKFIILFLASLFAGITNKTQGDMCRVLRKKLRQSVWKIPEAVTFTELRDEAAITQGKGEQTNITTEQDPGLQNSWERGSAAPRKKSWMAGKKIE